MATDFEVPEEMRPPRLGPSTAELTDRGREILDELGEIFVMEGFMHLTISDVAARLKCSRRTLYDLAPNRTELVLIVIDRRLRRIGRVAAEYLRTIEDPLERLEQFMLAGHSELHRPTARFAEDAARTPAVARLMSAYYRYHVLIMRSILDAGIAEGAFRALDTRVVAEVVDGAFARFSDPVFRRETGLTFEDATAELVRLLHYALLPEAAAASATLRRRRATREPARRGA